MNVEVATAGQAITVRRRGQVLRIRPPFNELAYLRTERRRAEACARHGWRGRSETEPLFVFDLFYSPGAADSLCWAGLLPVVLAAARAGGHEVHLEGTDTVHLPPSAWQRVTCLGPPDGVWIDFVRFEDRGLIRYRADQVSPARLACQVAAAWPELTFLILVESYKEAVSLDAALRAVTPNVCISTGRHQLQGRPRIVVATPRELWLAEVGRRQVVLVMNALAAVRQEVREKLLDAREARLYGFLDDQAATAPYERDLLTAVFGFGALTIPRHGRVERDVVFAFEPFGDGAEPDGDLSLVDLKRRFLWQHGLRNRRVASLARALRTGGPALSEAWPGLAEALGHPGPGDVAVLAESPEHAGALSRRLRGWAIRSRSRRGYCFPSAILIAPAEGLDLSGVGVVVRADGGVGLPPLPLPDCLAAPHRRPLVVVDFADRHHPVLRRHTRQRLDAYLGGGWTEAGVGHVEALAERFLETRLPYHRRTQP